MFTSAILLLAAAAAQGPTTQARDDNKIICKAERSVGTNLSSRICKTKGKWAAEREAARTGVQADINSRAGGLQKLDPWHATPGGAIPGPGGSINGNSPGT
jgi:hypothetical protein